jgi:Rod binding domain-containing protein
MTTGIVGAQLGIENLRDTAERVAGELARPLDTATVAGGLERSGTEQSSTEQSGLVGRLGNLASPAETTARAAKDPLKLAQAATEFESLLLAQILRSVRESTSEGWLGSSRSEVNPTMELAETQLARVMAERGALGITKMLMSGLAPDKASEAAARQEIQQAGANEEPRVTNTGEPEVVLGPDER